MTLIEAMEYAARVCYEQTSCVNNETEQLELLAVMQRLEQGTRDLRELVSLAAR